MRDPADYHIVTSRIVEDGEVYFRATVKEFPDIDEYADTSQDAYELALDTISSLVDLALDMGHDYPEPVPRPEQAFSGRVTLRMGKTLHQMAAEFAEEDGVSLNQFIVDRLSLALGMRTHSESQSATDVVLGGCFFPSITSTAMPFPDCTTHSMTQGSWADAIARGRPVPTAQDVDESISDLPWEQ